MMSLYLRLRPGGLDSHTYGMGVRYAPVNRLARIKFPMGKGRDVLLLRGFDLRYAHITRERRA